MTYAICGCYAVSNSQTFVLPSGHFSTNMFEETQLSVSLMQYTSYDWDVIFSHGDLERSGSVVECLTRDRRAAGSSLTGVTALCP